MKTNLHREWIDPGALEIVERLQRGGFESYLVGGCVRDLLVGEVPKDYDIATMAHPGEVKRLVHYSYIIGKRFRLVLVKRGEKQFEVATFRRDPRPEEGEADRHGKENIFGTPEEDAQRRDFTINALFYDPVNDQLIDFCKGRQDLEDGIVRVIGDPYLRIQEDPIRSLRALRLKHKLGFTLDTKLREAIQELAPLLKETALPRRREELLKILRLSDPALALHEAYDLGILEHIFPSLMPIYSSHESLEHFANLLNRCLSSSTTHEPADLFSALLYSLFRTGLDGKVANETPPEELMLQFKALMRDEIGMHNLEQKRFAFGYCLLPILTNIEEFRNLPPKRQRHLLSNESADLSLHFAKVDYLISVPDLMYLSNELELLRSEVSRRRHKRPPRKRRRPFHG